MLGGIAAALSGIGISVLGGRILPNQRLGPRPHQRCHTLGSGMWHTAPRDLQPCGAVGLLTRQLPMLSRLFILASAAIIATLGSIHLWLTFVGPKLRPRDPELESRLKAVSPVITSQTTMWKAWIGFNASHSFGMLLFGAIYGYLALARN